MNTREKQQMEKYIFELEAALKQYPIDKEAEKLYELYTQINALYANEIPAIASLFEEVQEYSGLVERNGKAIHAVLLDGINRNYYSMETELVNNTRAGLTAFPDALAPYNAAMEKYSNRIFERNLLDDMRLSLELLVRDILANRKPLEKQGSELENFLNTAGVSEEIIKMATAIFGFYTTYQNRYVKHNDAVNEIEVEYIIELTSIILKFLIRAKGGIV